MSNPELSRRSVVLGGLALGACAVHTKGRNGEVIASDGGGAWGRAQRLAFYKPFEKETGIRVRTVPYVMPGKLRTSIEQRRPVIDMADLSGSDVPVFERDELLMPLGAHVFEPADWTALQSAQRKPTRCAVPSLYSSVVMAYRKEAFAGREPRGWPDFWEKSRGLVPGSLGSGALGAMSGTYEAALLGDGVAPDKVYPLDWDRLFRSLSRVRPAIRKFWAAGGEPLQMLADRNAMMTSIWNGRVDLQLTEQLGIGFIWGQGILGANYWAVPKGAANAEHAFRLMGFAMRPDRQAHFARLIGYGPANPRALDLLGPERAATVPNAPGPASQQIVQDYDWWAQDVGSGQTHIDVAVRGWERWVLQS